MKHKIYKYMYDDPIITINRLSFYFQFNEKVKQKKLKIDFPSYARSTPQFYKE